MEKEKSQNNPKNIYEKEEELKESAEQTSEKSQADELVADGLSQNLSEETKEEDKSPEERILELEDKLARTFAEMENQRRRFEKEKEDAYEYGGFAFAKEALNLIDNLERSKQILSNDESLKNSESLKKTLEHFEIINKDLISVFSKNNIKPIESVNKKLDPNFHQAMIEIEDDEREPGTIIQEIQKGFTIKDRLLRPSLVGVAKKRLDKTEKNEENKDNLKEK